MGVEMYLGVLAVCVCLCCVGVCVTVCLAGCKGMILEDCAQGEVERLR
jgi:hypothetical protein